MPTSAKTPPTKMGATAVVEDPSTATSPTTRNTTPRILLVSRLTSLPTLFGERIGITDVVAEDRAERGAWVGCLTGALSCSEYEAGLAAAGFEQVSVAFTHQVGDGLHSAIITATKPAAADPATTATAPANRTPHCRWRPTPAAAANQVSSNRGGI